MEDVPHFPVFAPEGLPLELGGWGGGDGEPLDMVSVTHWSAEDRWIEVDSELGEDELDPGEELGDAPVEPRRFDVDGVDVPFAFATDGERWVATGSAGEVAITVRARGIEAGDVRLRVLAEPGGLVDGAIPAYRPSRAPAGGVLDPRRVSDLAAGTPLEALGATLAGLARGAFALVESKDAGASWIGGEPHLAAGAEWPRGAHGAMTFVAQVSLAELDPAVWTGPASGHLHVFCDIDPEDGSMEGAGACAVLHTPAGADLRPCPFPSDLHAYSRLPRRPVVPRAGLTLPQDAADFDALWTLTRRLHAQQGWRHPVGRLLGWPTWQNDDMMDHLASLGDGQALEWTLLLQTDALDAELYVALPAADLAAGRFDRAEAMIEHD